MMKARITDLYDDGALPDTRFIGAEGFCLVIDVDGGRTMFGAGHRDRYLRNNLDAAEFDTDALERVVIPDGTSSRAGAISEVLSGRSSPLEIMASEQAWGTQDILRRPAVRIRAESEDMANRVTIDDWTKVSEHLHITPPIGGELFLVIRGALGPIVVSGACSCGVSKVFEVVRGKFGRDPVGFIGAFRTGRREDRTADAAAAEFERSGTTLLYLNHCTGVRGINRVRTHLGLAAVKDLYAGQTVEVHNLLRFR